MRTATLRIVDLFVAVALCLAAGGCAWIEGTSSRFSDRQEAEAAEMFAKGWLPQWLPQSSENLREKHVHDTSASILRFEYDTAKDAPPFGGACEPTERKRVESPRVDAWWWPDAPTLRSMPHLYDCRDDSGYLAVPAEGGIAYFWRASL